MASRIRAEWCPCANDGRGGWGYFKGENAVNPPKDIKHRRRLIHAARRSIA